VGPVHRAGAIKAIQTVTQEITGQAKKTTINALGFCVGGTMLGTSLAVLAARGEKPVASATLLTTLLDFTDTGILDVFIDEAFVNYREKEMGNGGLMKGQDLASTFSFLRPNDLVWNYVVGNYLKGETPPPFDLLYWNSDSAPICRAPLRLVPAQHLPGKQPHQAGQVHGGGREGGFGQGGHPGLHLRLA
jgi:polyhydroxyalkanoate synthase